MRTHLLLVYHRTARHADQSVGYEIAGWRLLVNVRFLPEGKRVRGEVGEDLLAVARRGNVDFLGPCAGRALCARCVLRVTEGERRLSALTADEGLVLKEAQIADGYRLGCR